MDIIITKETLDKLYQDDSMYDEYQKFVRRPLFYLPDQIDPKDAEVSDYVFCPENIYSNQDLLREFFYQLSMGVINDPEDPALDIDIRIRNGVWIGVIIDKTRTSNNKYAIAWINKYDCIISLFSENNDMNLEEYLYILNLLNQYNLLDYTSLASKTNIDGALAHKLITVDKTFSELFNEKKS